MNARLKTADFPVFRTLRLSCRPVEPRDAAFYTDLFGRPETVAHRPDPSPLAPQTAALQLGEDVAHWCSHGFGRWLMSHAGEPIGIGGLRRKAGFEGLNLSYHLLPDYWGNGLASEFVRGTLDFARDVLEADEVYGIVRPSNKPGIRVLEKADFAHAGELTYRGARAFWMRHRLR